MAKRKKKVNQNLIFVLISLLIIGVVFFVVSLVKLFRKPADTIMLKNGELINYEEVVGYVIREEEIVDTSEYDGMIKTAVSDAERVAKGATIMNYVSKEEEQLVKKISELDAKIEKAIDSQQTIFPNDVKTLETEIENYIYANLKDSNFIDATRQYTREINTRIEKKAKIVGELSPAGSELKSLINERTKYETELNNSEKAVVATKSGLVSYRIDGYENILTPQAFSELTIDYLEGLKVTKDQVVSTNNKKVKLVDNFNCYIAVPLSAESAKNISLNSKIYLRFENMGDRLTTATVEYYSNEDDQVLVIFKVDENVEELTKYRKLGLDVVWWRTKGLKVNEDAIYYTAFEVESGDEKSEIVTETPNEPEETASVSGENVKVMKTIQIPTVTIKKAYYNTQAYVKVLKSAKGFAIIENYSADELKNMGISQDIIDNRATVKLYDEVLVID